MDPSGLFYAEVFTAPRNSSQVMFLDCHVKPEPGWERAMFKNTNENYKRLVVPLIPKLDGDTWEVTGAN